MPTSDPLHQAYALVNLWRALRMGGRYVRLNGRTIGVATSGADRANDDAARMFDSLWRNSDLRQMPAA
jgi:hypothetical protein